MTTQVVSLKAFRLKAKMIKRAVEAYLFEDATSHGSHDSTMRCIRVFPNSLQPKVYPPDQVLIFDTLLGRKRQGGKERMGETGKRGKGEREI